MDICHHKFKKKIPEKIIQLLVGFDQHLHVGNEISHVRKKADRILLDKLLYILIDNGNFDEEKNGLLILL